MLVLLSDVDGLYTANPNGDDTATHLSGLNHPRYLAMAGPRTRQNGGMVTKLPHVCHICRLSDDYL